MKAYILIKIHPGEVKQVVKQLRKIDMVKNAEMTLGPYDAIAIVENGDLSKLGSLIATEIQPIPGVEETLTCLAIDI
jgi:DNA-binding Lrp family transcriptional regulator